MDPAALATAVVAFLIPFVAEAAKSAAGKAGQALWEKVETMFKGKPAAETALADFKQQPADPDNQASLRKELRKLAEADKRFHEEIQQLLEAAQKAAPAGVSYHADNNSGTLAQGNNNTVVGAGGSHVGGSVGGDVVTGTKAPAFDQRGQQVGTQTNIAGDGYITNEKKQR